MQKLIFHHPDTPTAGSAERIIKGENMKLRKRTCGIQMNMEERGGQRGWLEINGERVNFWAIDGMTDFFGQLIHVLCGLLGMPRCHCSGHRKTKFVRDDRYSKLVGTMNWDCQGAYSYWTLTRDVTKSNNWHEDFLLHMQIKDYAGGEDEVVKNINVVFRDFCYAVAKCGTEFLKEHGIFGYLQTTSEYEDINLREFLAVKAFALDVADEIGTDYPHKPCKDLDKELELLLFDM